MYFWNIDKLKNDLIERPATEREALPYLIAMMLLCALSMYSNLPTDFGLLFFINFFIVIFGTGYGIFWLYQLNNTKPDNYFLQRYIMLGWVLLIRYIVIFIVPLAILMAVLFEKSLGEIGAETTSWADIIFNIIGYVMLYWYFRKHLLEVTQKALY